MINIDIEPVLENSTGKTTETEENILQENHEQTHQQSEENVNADRNGEEIEKKEAVDASKDKEKESEVKIETSEIREQPVIEVNNADIYQKNILILSNISFTVKQGELVYVVGKTGSGKSNLLKLLYGEVPVKNGDVKVAGYSMLKIKSRNIQRLRRKLGIVFQDFQLLYDRSVYENLKFVTKVTGWKDHVKRDERIEEVLNMVGLKTKGHKMPHQLSGGEQQRICIARALVNNPEIILADEPTGNLDPETSFEIFKLFHEISKKGTSVMIATHNYTIINQLPSRVLYINQGKVTE
jgi:cell division transport system ATP-binding protein